MEKSLGQQQAELKARNKEIDNELLKLEAEKKANKHKMHMLQQQPRLSDHALLRIYERIMGVSREQVEESVMTPDVIEKIEAGAVKIKKDGMELRISNKCITTVIY